MTRKIRGHPELQPGETAIEAVYGLGRTMLAAADSVGSRRGGGGYSGEYDRAAGGSDAPKRASAISGNGVLVVTDRRLLFFRKRFAIGTPRDLVATSRSARWRRATTSVRCWSSSSPTGRSPRCTSPGPRSPRRSSPP